MDYIGYVLLAWCMSGIVATFLIWLKKRLDPETIGMLYALSLIAGPFCFFSAYQAWRD